MSKAPIKTNSNKRLKVSDRTRTLYEQRDMALDNDPDGPTLPPGYWENATIVKYYRPLKTQIS